MATKTKTKPGQGADADPIFDAKKFPREELARNVSSWNRAHRRLKMKELALEVKAGEIRDVKKSLAKAFDELYSTPPEIGVTESATLFDQLDDDPGELNNVKIDLSSGSAAAATVFPLVRQYLGEEKFSAWCGDFLDVGACFLTGEK